MKLNVELFEICELCDAKFSPSYCFFCTSELYVPLFLSSGFCQRSVFELG